MKQIEFNDYIKKIRDLISQELKKLKQKQEDMLLNHFSEEQKNTYYQVHTASMMNGKIWEIVFFNRRDWEQIKKIDGKSNTRKIIIELKNKPTTFNYASKKGTIRSIVKLQKKYPNYSCIIGFINDDLNTDFIDDKNKIRYMGGDSLFKYVFGEKYRKEIQEKVSSFYDKKK